MQTEVAVAPLIRHANSAFLLVVHYRLMLGDRNIFATRLFVLKAFDCQFIGFLFAMIYLSPLTLQLFFNKALHIFFLW